MFSSSFRRRERVVSGGWGWSAWWWWWVLGQRTTNSVTQKVGEIDRDPGLLFSLIMFNYEVRLLETARNADIFSAGILFSFLDLKYWSLRILFFFLLSVSLHSYLGEILNRQPTSCVACTFLGRWRKPKNPEEIYMKTQTLTVTQAYVKHYFKQAALINNIKIGT